MASACSLLVNPDPTRLRVPEGSAAGDAEANDVSLDVSTDTPRPDVPAMPDTPRPDAPVGCMCSGGLMCCGDMCRNVATDPANCGGCNNVCPRRPNANPTCTARMCSIDCLPGSGNCDRNVDNGCETNLTNNVENCGACGNRCTGAGGSVSQCVMGRCVTVTCPPNTGDCDGNTANGCESPLITTSR